MTEGHTERLEAALDGRYLIESALGEGGMATVYLANDIKHERKVALKVLKPELAAVVGAERFLAEIKTTANLQHPNILPLFDSGSAGGLLYYVMPYVRGETLRDHLTRVNGGTCELVASFMPNATGTTLHLEGLNGPLGRTGLMLMSAATGPAIPLNQGLLCLSPPFARYHPQPASLLGVPGLNSIGRFDTKGTNIFMSLAGASHITSGFDVPLETPAYPSIPLIVSGSTWAFQLWFRDVDGGGGPSSNMSNAIEILFP